MQRIGLTGGIAAGKSVAARRLAELGAVVIDSDVLAREAVAPGSAGLDAVAKSLELLADNPDQVYGPGIMLTAAQYYAQARRADLAVPMLAKALAAPGIGQLYSPVLLWLDPMLDPIRHDPGFQTLLKQYAKYKPAVTYDTSVAAGASSPAASAPASSSAAH